MTAATAGNNAGSGGGVKALSGMMSVLNPFGKSKPRHGSGSTSGGRGGGRAGGGGGSETVPRSYGLNGGPTKAESERLSTGGEAPAAAIARRCVSE